MQNLPSMRESKDHLGNVRVVVTDLKHSQISGSVPINFMADVRVMRDHYPFGMQMEGQVYPGGGGDYRYGFNGMERDDEVHGEGSSYDFGARMYGPRVGRFLNTDPLEMSLIPFAPYQFAINGPIQFIDFDGMGPRKVINNSSETVVISGDASIRKVDREGIERYVTVRGRFALEPGDVFEYVGSISEKLESGEIMEYEAGRISRASGCTELVPISDVDFIDVQEGQEFMLTAKATYESQWLRLLHWDSGDEKRLVRQDENKEWNSEGYVPIAETWSGGGIEIDRGNDGFVRTPNRGEIKFDDTQGGELLIRNRCDNEQGKVFLTGGTGLILR